LAPLLLAVKVTTKPGFTSCLEFRLRGYLLQRVQFVSTFHCLLVSSRGHFLEARKLVVEAAEVKEVEVEVEVKRAGLHTQQEELVKTSEKRSRREARATMFECLK